MSLARQRLVEERKAWRKARPFGFSAKPRSTLDGETDMMTWDAEVPGKDASAYGNVTYKLRLVFNDSYPVEPPVVYFEPPIFHINVFPNGQVCMSLLYSDKDWRPNISLGQLLLGIQELVSRRQRLELDNPNPASVACDEAYQLHRSSKQEYEARIRREAALYRRVHNADASGE